MKTDTESAKNDNRLQDGVQSDSIITQLLKDDRSFPNNGKLPLVVYRGILALPQSRPAAVVENLFESNGWSGCWRNGIFGFHHYHSTAHEVLGVYSGSAEVQMGGPGGVCLTVGRGDVIIIPAGVAHKNLAAGRNFQIVGAYPLNQGPDMCYGKAGERPQPDKNIARVPLPQMDPVYGVDGPLAKQWKILG
ncbi:Cupin domain-containing protein [Olavius sp. associated proteobacterium Delta 1]|nr:Cupin domain-containing protein [Olavius sp. associated proteobacterium Delta 1]